MDLSERRSSLGVFHCRCQLVCGLLFEFGQLFYLMPILRCDVVNNVQLRTSDAWAVSCYLVLIWGLLKSFTMFDIRSKFGLAKFC